MRNQFLRDVGLESGIGTSSEPKARRKLIELD
jgi:hypothetical protein